jgi:hypothetical protein
VAVEWSDKLQEYLIGTIFCSALYIFECGGGGKVKVLLCLMPKWWICVKFNGPFTDAEHGVDLKLSVERMSYTIDFSERCMIFDERTLEIIGAKEWKCLKKPLEGAIISRREKEIRKVLASSQHHRLGADSILNRFSNGDLLEKIVRDHGGASGVDDIYSVDEVQKILDKMAQNKLKGVSSASFIGDVVCMRCSLPLF